MSGLTYKGLAVGGVLDGSIIEDHQNMLNIERQPGTYKVVVRSDGTPSLFQPHKYVRYIFVDRYWLPYDPHKGVPSILVALEALEADYFKNRHPQQGTN